MQRSYHCLFSILPVETPHDHTLRERGHNFVLPRCQNNIYKISFLNKWLFSIVYFFQYVFVFLYYCGVLIWFLTNVDLPLLHLNKPVSQSWRGSAQGSAFWGLENWNLIFKLFIPKIPKKYNCAYEENLKILRTVITSVVYNIKSKFPGDGFRARPIQRRHLNLPPTNLVAMTTKFETK